MLAAAVITFRFLQYSGAMILLGSSLFFLYGLPAQGPCAAAAARWPRRLLAFSAALLLVAVILGLITQTGLLAGSLYEGFKPDNLQAVITQMNFGWSSLVRAGLAAALLLCLAVFSLSRLLWGLCALGGAFVCASFAWTGHGAATEGPGRLVHLFSDIAHLLAAAVWIGALVAYLFLLTRKQNAIGGDEILYHSLRQFSGVGTAAVAIIVLTGLGNSWFLVGPDRLMDFWSTLYGQVLLTKLLVFAAMLGLAASNRYRLTPALGDALDLGQSRLAPLAALRRSLAWETLAAFAVLGLVAWLGTLEPAATALGGT